MSTEEVNNPATDATEQNESSEPTTPADPHEIEKREEQKLTLKYPSAAKPMAGHSAFLQKRLAKGQKYFDSGDYQMAKQAGKGKARTMPPILSVAPENNYSEIPTAESVTTRKTSVVQPSKLASNS